MLVVNAGAAGELGRRNSSPTRRRIPASSSFGSGSNGSAGHLAGELFKVDTGTDVVHIPFKGGAPATQALLAGDTQFMFDNLANAMAQVKAGKLKAIAVTTAQRSQARAGAADDGRGRLAGLRHLDLVRHLGAGRARRRTSSRNGTPR